MGKKKKGGTLSFAELTGAGKRVSNSRKRVKKAAKYHAGEMKIGRKKFRKVNGDDIEGSLKKAHRRYRCEHADQLADILLGSQLKNPDKFDEKLQDMIERKKLFDPSKRGQMKRIAKKQPSLMAYANICTDLDPDMVQDILKSKVRKLSDVVGDKAAIRIAPLAARSDSARVLRMMMKLATEKDPTNFDAQEFFSIIRPKKISKKEWRETVVSTVLGIRGSSNNALKDIITYAINMLGGMPKDRIKKILRRYADSITKVSESGEKLNFLVTLKDLSDDPKIDKVLNNNPKIASVIGQL